VWESARFTGIFLASAFSCSQAESTPAHTRVTQTVGRLATDKQHIHLFSQRETVVTGKTKPSIVRIVKSDYLAYIGTLIPLISLIMYIGFACADYFGYLIAFREHESIQSTEGVSIFFYIFIIGLVFGTPLAIWRIRYIQQMFSDSVEVVGQITNISIYKDRGRFEYTYTYQGQLYSGNNFIMKTKKSQHLRSNSQVVLLVNPDEPTQTLIRDVYI
jgi:hypothetical protein